MGTEQAWCSFSCRHSRKAAPLTLNTRAHFYTGENRMLFLRPLTCASAPGILVDQTVCISSPSSPSANPAGASFRLPPGLSPAISLHALGPAHHHAFCGPLASCLVSPVILSLPGQSSCHLGPSLSPPSDSTYPSSSFSSAQTCWPSTLGAFVLLLQGVGHKSSPQRTPHTSFSIRTAFCLSLNLLAPPLLPVCMPLASC